MYPGPGEDSTEPQGLDGKAFPGPSGRLGSTPFWKHGQFRFGWNKLVFPAARKREALAEHSGRPSQGRRAGGRTAFTVGSWSACQAVHGPGGELLLGTPVRRL